MGIPRFATRMRDYGTLKLLTQPDSDKKTLAIIDGPSLAHSLLNTPSFRTTYSDDSINPYPDYVALGHQAIAWLRNLETHGFEIAAIYFDGALPSHKRTTRLSRLQAYVDHLHTFKQTHTELAKGTRASNVPSDWVARQLETARRNLAPPAFLVFAVVEALQGSRYGDRTWVVGGEADAFCAARARSVCDAREGRAVTVFTNDSDLMVCAVGEATRVVMINAMEEGVGEGGGKVLSGLEFWPAELARMAGGGRGDLLAVAFRMREPAVTFREALKGGEGEGKGDGDGMEWREFVAAYDVESAAEQLKSLEQGLVEGEKLLQMDSRVAELVRQVTAQAAPVSSNREPAPSADFFLPVLFEDPSRSTAWKVGAPFRDIAEGFLAGASPHAVSAGALEHRRAGARISARQMQSSLSWVQLIEQLDALETELHKALNASALTLTVERWKLATFAVTLRDLTQQNESIPSIEDGAKILSGTPVKEWASVHLAAQYQAQFYSFRMLKQVLEFILTDRALDNFHAPLTGMMSRLKDLPTIGDFFENMEREKSKCDNLTQWGEILTGVYAAFGYANIAPLNEVTKSSGQKQKKRKRKGNAETGGGKEKRQSQSNPFAALAD